MADRSESEGNAEPGSLWYRLGFALERARASSSPSHLRSLAERLPHRAKDDEGGRRRPARGESEDGKRPGDAKQALLTASTGAIAAKVLDFWPARRPGVGSLLRAGLSGAGAALVHQLVRPLLDGEPPGLDDELAEALAAGAARGLVYAAIVEPRLAGRPLARGLLYGALEYAVSPWGGLPRLLGRAAPHSRVPLLPALFEGYDPAEDTLTDHVAFAVALAVLYGDRRDGELAVED
ncbi:MAG: hypothetical protein PVI57_08625 [Gemmatimonadota bacterium]|jgi:hypothetical protein